MALDKSKPYGTVMGGNFPYQFEQDGKYFNASGEEVSKTGAKVDSQDDDTDKNGYLKIAEIKAALDKMGIQYNPELKRPELMAIYDAELAKRAS